MVRIPSRVAIAMAAVCVLLLAGRCVPAPPVAGPAATVEILTADLLLVEEGETRQARAVVLDEEGLIVPGAEIVWTSSDDAIATVDRDGIVTAGAGVGTAVITANHGGASDRIWAVVAQLRPEAVRLAREDVLAVDDEHTLAQLARNASTDRIVVGTLFTDGETVLGRALAVDVADDVLTVVIEQAAIPDVFSRVDVAMETPPVDIEVVVDAEGGVVMSTATGFEPTLIHPGFLSDACKFDWVYPWNSGNAPKPKIKNPDITAGVKKAKLIVEMKVDERGHETFVMVIEGTPYVTAHAGEVTFEASAGFTYECAIQLAEIPLGILPVFGPFLTIEGSIPLKIGFELETKAVGRVRAKSPSGTAEVALRVGAEHTVRGPDRGWNTIAEATPAFVYSPPTMDTRTGVDARFEPYVALAASIGVKTLKLTLVGIEIIEPRLYLRGRAKLDLPVDHEELDYKGPTWSIDYGARTKLKFELTGGVQRLLQLLRIKTAYSRNFDLFGPVEIVSSPVPTVTIEPPSSSATGDGSWTLRSRTGVEGADDRSHIEFWSFADPVGLTPGRMLATAQIGTDGEARTAWNPGTDDAGGHTVRAYLFHPPFAAVGLPYASKRSATMTVPIASITHFSADPPTLLAGLTTTLSWTVDLRSHDAPTCYLDVDVADPSWPPMEVGCSGTHDHTYRTSGTRTARLVVRVGTDEVAAATEIAVNAAVIRSFAVAPDPVIVGRDATFSWTYDVAPGTELRCYLDVAGSESLVGCNRPTARRFDTMGPRTARLRITDGHESVTAELEFVVRGCGSLVVETETTMAAGAAHSLAIDPAGAVWSWGDNAHGQLGNPACGAVSDTPCSVTSLSGTFVAVAAGERHSLALSGSGFVYAWGDNRYGQLGIDSRIERSDVPYVVMDCTMAVGGRCTPLLNVKAIAAGRYFSLAVADGGGLWAWGSNAHGQLGQDPVGPDVCGDGYDVCSRSAVRVSVSGGEQFIFAAVAAGAGHGLALDTFGRVWSWGDNGYGQLGRDTVQVLVAPGYDNYVPRLVTLTEPEGPLEDVQLVRAGAHHSLAMQTAHVGEYVDGTVWAWGRNDLGQVGNPDLETEPVVREPTLVWAEEMGCVAGISAGDHHSLALSIASSHHGRVWAWGTNAAGQLGTADRRDPAWGPVLGLPPPYADAWVCLAGGGAHTVACDGEAQAAAWGRNDAGQLGVGDRESRREPEYLGFEVRMP